MTNKVIDYQKAANGNKVLDYQVAQSVGPPPSPPGVYPTGRARGRRPRKRS